MAELELSSLKRWKGKQDEMTGAYWRKTKEARKQAIKNFKEQKFLKKLEKQSAKQQKTEKDQEEKKEQKERLPTVSVALPGSVLDNAQSPDLRTYLAGQIARACTVFCVDEIVVFDEQGEDAKQIVFVYYCGLDEDQTTFFEQLVQKTRTVEGEFQGIGKKGHASVQLARILQYLECPQYLRKSFFPKHRDLQFAGLLNPLDSPHHMRIDEASEYREGVVVDKPSKPNKGSFVNCGMRKDVQIDRCLRAGLRVTVQLHKNKHPESKRFKGTVVAPHVPRMESGLYWGYTVRLASCLSAVFTECPFEDGYDLTIGTSERGSNTDGTTLPSFRFPDLITDEDEKGKTKSLKLDPPLRSTMADLVSDIYLAAQYRHMLVVFGGLKGLEASVDADENLKLTEPSVLFHHYLNTCPGQGSRTIRTEEAILITLSALRPKIDSALRRADSS